MVKAKELCLEDYVRFFNKEELALNVDQLRKIGRINGLIKLKNINRSRLLDALRAVNLTPPGRSTVGESMLRTSTNADLPLEKVMKDIATLGWQECPIVSILTVGNECAMKATEEMALISSSYSSDQAMNRCGKPGETKASGAKRKRKNVLALAKLPLKGPVEEKITCSTSGSHA